MWMPALGLRGILRLTRVQGRLHRQRRGGGRRQRRLRLHAVSRRPGVLRQSAVGRPRRLGDDAEAPLRHRRADAGRQHGAVRQRQPAAVEAGGGAFRRAGHLPAHAGRHLLRRARQGRARPLLRRQRPGAHRLHALRRVHGRLPRRRQEHAAEELPVVRREGGRADPARAPGHRHPSARRGRRQRRLPGHHAAARRLVHQAAAHVHHARRRDRRRRAGNQRASGALQAHRRAARQSAIGWASWCAPTANPSSP